MRRLLRRRGRRRGDAAGRARASCRSTRCRSARCWPTSSGWPTPPACPTAAGACARRPTRRIDAVRAAVAGAPRPRVVALEWLDPPFIGGHWVPEMIELAGGLDVARPRRRALAHGRPGMRSRRRGPRSRSRCRAATTPRGRPRRRAPTATRLDSLGADRVVAVDASAYFSRPGPRLVTGIELLAHILHPDRVAGSRGERGRGSRCSSTCRCGRRDLNPHGQSPPAPKAGASTVPPRPRGAAQAALDTRGTSSQKILDSACEWRTRATTKAGCAPQPGKAGVEADAGDRHLPAAGVRGDPDRDRDRRLGEVPGRQAGDRLLHPGVPAVRVLREPLEPWRAAGRDRAVGDPDHLLPRSRRRPGSRATRRASTPRRCRRACSGC